MRGKWKPTISVTHLTLRIGAVTCAHVLPVHKHKPTRERNGPSPLESLCWEEDFFASEKKAKSIKGDGDLASNSKVGYPG